MDCSSAAFIPLKNVDWQMLRHQFMVLKLSTMAPKVDKVIGAEFQVGVKSTDTSIIIAGTIKSRFPLCSLLYKCVGGFD